MKKFAMILAAGALISAIGIGCGKKESSEHMGKEPPEVKKAETMDSTRLDSAVDTMQEHMTDSMAHDSM